MVRMDWSRGFVQPGPEIRESVKTLAQLDRVFADIAALRRLDPNTVVYRVQAWCPVSDGTEGAQFWGTTIIEPGQIGSEYFMTHGHFHAKRDRTEYYGTLQGEGALILMDEDRKTWMELMSVGTLHFLPPHTAHRVANIGKGPLHFVACWPSDAGHDYESVVKYGFGARLLNINGKPSLVPQLSSDRGS